MNKKTIHSKDIDNLLDRIIEDMDIQEIVEITSDEEGGLGIIHWSKIRRIMKKHLKKFITNQQKGA